MSYSLGDQRVKLVGERHFVAPGAAVIGDVARHGDRVGRHCNRSVRERQ